MSEITLVRMEAVEITDADREACRRVIFGMVDGLGERGRRQWRSLWRRILKMEPGEMIDLWTHQARMGWYHRKHMALEQRLFDSQERFEQFEAFRDWLKVGAGHVDWYPGPKGGVFPVPKSTSYSAMDQGDMEKFHGAAVDFLRTPHAGKTLWRHLSEAQRIEAVEAVLSRFGE